MTKLNKEPYSYFFLAGAVSGGFGVLLWLLHQAGLLGFYPLHSHASLMYFSFLGAFISGFLLTTVPKITNSRPANTLEVLGILVIIPFCWLTAATGAWRLQLATFFIQQLLLLMFLKKRLAGKNQLPFEGFIFLPFAFTFSISGLLYNFVAAAPNLEIVYSLSGEAFVLNLICGLGARMIPLLSRLPLALGPEAQNTMSRPKQFLLAAVLLNFTYLLQVFGYPQLGYLLRALVVFAVAVRFFRITEKPVIFSFVGLGLKVAIGFIVVGFGLASLHHQSPVASLHLVYIGGLSLLTLMVATRVSFAHDGKTIENEVKSKSILVVVLLTAAAAVFRFFSGNNSTGFLLFSVLLFLGAIVSWKLSVLLGKKN